VESNLVVESQRFPERNDDTLKSERWEMHHGKYFVEGALWYKGCAIRLRELHLQ
jgi:hypothetical protein